MGINISQLRATEVSQLSPKPTKSTTAPSGGHAEISDGHLTLLSKASKVTATSPRKHECFSEVPVENAQLHRGVGGPGLEDYPGYLNTLSGSAGPQHTTSMPMDASFTNGQHESFSGQPPVTHCETSLPMSMYEGGMSIQGTMAPTNRGPLSFVHSADRHSEFHRTISGGTVYVSGQPFVNNAGHMPSLAGHASEELDTSSRRHMPVYARTPNIPDSRAHVPTSISSAPISTNGSSVPMDPGHLPFNADFPGQHYIDGQMMSHFQANNTRPPRARTFQYGYTF